MVMKNRIRAARHLLLNTNQTITEIAHRTGFYDHSHFIKQFQKDVGMSPTDFKRKYSQRFERFTNTSSEAKHLTDELFAVAVQFPVGGTPTFEEAEKIYTG